MPPPTRPEPVSRRARPAKAPLTRAGIVAAAIRILDTSGLDGVTMRKLAQELDTAPGSLYVYFANRDELLASVYDEVLGELELPPPDGTGKPTATGDTAEVTTDGGPDWRQELVDLLLRTVDVLGAHGGIARVALGAIPTGPNAVALAEAILGLLVRGGVGEQAAAWAVDQFMLYVNAAALELSTFVARGSRPRAMVADLRARYAELPAERYPNVSRMREVLVTGSGEQRARWFLGAVLDGMTATRPGDSAERI